MSNKDKAKNFAQVTKGRIKQVLGRGMNRTGLESDGKSDQVKGNLKQAGEKVKDAFEK